jgi:hypothetical protein
MARPGSASRTSRGESPLDVLASQTVHLHQLLAAPDTLDDAQRGPGHAQGIGQQGDHGAIGLALDSTYSRLAGLLAEGDWRRILALLSRLGFSLYAPELSQYLGDRSDPRCPLIGLDEFREHLGGELTVMLLEGIGRGIEVHEIDEARMIASITRLSHTSATSWRGQWLQALEPAR